MFLFCFTNYKFHKDKQRRINEQLFCYFFRSLTSKKRMYHSSFRWDVRFSLKRPSVPLCLLILQLLIYQLQTKPDKQMCNALSVRFCYFMIYSVFLRLFFAPSYYLSALQRKFRTLDFG